MTATYRTVKVEEKQLVGCTCNQCGWAWDGADDTVFGIVEHTYTGGYGSNPLDDLMQYTFSLCETCLAKMFLGFRTPPQMRNLIAGDDDWSWEEEKQQITKRIGVL